MRYINNGTNVYHSFGDGKLRHAIFAVYGKQTAEQMVAVDACEGGTRIYGLIGIGEQAKATRAHQAFFINGRTVRCALLSRALEEVCRSRVTIGMYPMCALNLVVPPTSVNVNVHPNKLEVRFKDEAMMRGVAERLLATAFEGEKVLQIGLDRPSNVSVERVATVREITPIPVVEDRPAPAARDVHAPAVEAISESSPALPQTPPKPASMREKPMQLDVFQRVVREELQKLGDTRGDALREDRLSDLAPVSKHTSLNEGPSEAPPVQAKVSAEPPVEAPKPSYRVIGVALNTYILIEADDSLMLIDQHAAHERLQYEKFMAQLEAGRGSQQLLTPMILPLVCPGNRADHGQCGRAQGRGLRCGALRRDGHTGARGAVHTGQGRSEASFHGHCERLEPGSQRHRRPSPRRGHANGLQERREGGRSAEPERDRRAGPPDAGHRRTADLPARQACDEGPATSGA